MNIVATEAGGGNMEINKTDFHIPAARRLRDQLISLNQLAKGYALRGQGHCGISQTDLNRELAAPLPQPKVQGGQQ